MAFTGVVSKPLFFGLFLHCSIGASGLYHCGIVGSRDAWRVVKKKSYDRRAPLKFDSEFANEKGKYTFL